VLPRKECSLMDERLQFVPSVTDVSGPDHEKLVGPPGFEPGTNGRSHIM
jgi:hypothetical protein